MTYDLGIDPQLRPPHRQCAARALRGVRRDGENVNPIALYMLANPWLWWRAFAFVPASRTE